MFKYIKAKLKHFFSYKWMAIGTILIAIGLWGMCLMPLFGYLNVLDWNTVIWYQFGELGVIIIGFGLTLKHFINL